MGVQAMGMDPSRFHSVLRDEFMNYVVVILDFFAINIFYHNRPVSVGVYCLVEIFVIFRQGIRINMVKLKSEPRVWPLIPISLLITAHIF